MPTSVLFPHCRAPVMRTILVSANASLTDASACRGINLPSGGRRREHFDGDERAMAQRRRGRRGRAPVEECDAPNGLPERDRWQACDKSVPSERGDAPYAGWLVSELDDVDTDLGSLKTGNDA